MIHGGILLCFFIVLNSSELLFNLPSSTIRAFSASEIKGIYIYVYIASSKRFEEEYTLNCILTVPFRIGTIHFKYVWQFSFW